MTERLGIYFGLEARDYHEDHALGSGDVKNLIKSPTAFWRGSWMNPRRPPVDKSTPDQEVGKAIHKIVLEGRQAFEGIYMRRPDDDPEDSPSQKGARTKEWNKRAADARRTLLHGDDWSMAVYAAATIASNQQLADAFQGGMPEVSIFWMRDGVRCKARIDYLKAVGIGDIKSIANERGREIEEACKTEMSMRRHPVQAAHYLDARRQVGRFFDDGLVYGDHEPGWLRGVAATTRFAFQYVFYEKQDPPDVWSCVLSPANPLIEFEHKQIGDAIERYKVALGEFGTDRPWLSAKPVREFTLDDLPMHYGRG